MMEAEHKTMNRRTFFRAAIRNVLLGGLAALGGALVLRQRHSDRDHTCTNQGICRGCGAFDGCRLPQALSAKRHLALHQEKNNDR